MDWQLTHAESIRATIQDHYKMGHQKQTDFNPKSNPLVLMPIGTDRKKKRYWSFDGQFTFIALSPCSVVSFQSRKTRLVAHNTDD